MVDAVGKSVSPPGGLECEVGLLYRMHAQGLYRYAGLLNPDGGAAQDALQEAFLRYCKARSQGRTITNPKAWLFRVLRNLSLDAVKASGARPEVALDRVPERCARGADPESAYHRAELLAQARAALAPRELECIRLRAEGMPYEEIAEVLEISIGTVSALVTRAHKKLQGVLASEGRTAHFRLMPQGSPYAP